MNARASHVIRVRAMQRDQVAHCHCCIHRGHMENCEGCGPDNEWRHRETVRDVYAGEDLLGLIGRSNR